MAISIEHVKAYDHLKILREMCRENTPSENHIQDRVNAHIESVIGENKKLGYFFTNYDILEATKKIPYGRTLALFPLADTPIKYLVVPGSFWQYLGSEPKKIVTAEEGMPRKITNMLLFSKDPYKHREDYTSIEKLLAPIKK